MSSNFANSYTKDDEQGGKSSVKICGSTNVRKIVYIYDNELAKCTDKITHISGRSRMVHELVDAYGLTRLMKCKPSKLASITDLLRFHSQDYVDFLFDSGLGELGNNSLTEDEEDGDDKQSCNNSGNLEVKYGISRNSSVFNQESLDEFGLGYDCPVFKELGTFALKIAGGTISAAGELVEGADIAINWCGGWHHAQRGEASGFCYVNDIVLGIHELQKKFKRILYVDLDAHHGDGVENAFAFSNKVMTLSFHHYEAGYFPGTGKVMDVGQGRGKYYSLNVPLKAGIVDTQFIFVFDSIIGSTLRNFQPDAIVVQCGADSLAKDPLGAFNLTLESMSHCVRTILSKSLPTLLLGGGGYNVANAARLWTRLTADAVNRELGNDIPDNKYFLKYGPDFELSVEPSLRKNENDDEYISELIEAVTGHFVSLKKRMEAVC